MLAELTAEESVTKILSSYQILRSGKDSFVDSERKNLGKFLQTAPKVDLLDELNIKKVSPSDKRFAFINTRWKI